MADRERETGFAPSGASQPIPDGKPTSRAEFDRDALDPVKIIDGIGTWQKLAEWQHDAACKFHHQTYRGATLASGIGEPHTRAEFNGEGGRGRKSV